MLFSRKNSMIEGRYEKLGRFDAEFISQVLNILPLSLTEKEEYRIRFLKEFGDYSVRGRKKGEPVNEGCVRELEEIAGFDILNPEITARWLKEHQHTKYQKNNVKRERDSFYKIINK